jgi:hypothetical protein
MYLEFAYGLRYLFSRLPLPIRGRNARGIDVESPDPDLTKSGWERTCNKEPDPAQPYGNAGLALIFLFDMPVAHHAMLVGKANQTYYIFGTCFF